MFCSKYGMALMSDFELRVLLPGLKPWSWIARIRVRGRREETGGGGGGGRGMGRRRSRRKTSRGRRRHCETMKIITPNQEVVPCQPTYQQLDLWLVMGSRYGMYNLFQIISYCITPDVFHSQDLIISNSPCSLIRNITSRNNYRELGFS